MHVVPQLSVAQPCRRGSGRAGSPASPVLGARNPPPVEVWGDQLPPQRLLGLATLCCSVRRMLAWAGGWPRPGSLQPAAPSASVSVGLGSKSPWQEL